MRPLLSLAHVLALAPAMTGCQSTPANSSTPMVPMVHHGFVTDMPAFDAFLATHPTPAQFRAAYPDVQLVMPNTITTMDFRSNNSRYFVELDKDGRIIGGHFG